MAHTVQQQVETNVGDIENKQWNEVVEDLWDNLHHLQELYSDGGFVYDPHTMRYGFQEGFDYDSEEDLMAKLLNEREEHTAKMDEEEFFVSNQQPSLGMYREEVELSSANICVPIKVVSFSSSSPTLLHNAVEELGAWCRFTAETLSCAQTPPSSCKEKRSGITSPNPCRSVEQPMKSQSGVC